ncbi:ubiquitin-related domain-containing protein, partial [Jimgerdemannia flammicorona]
MPPIKVSIKWSGKKYDDIELSTDESALVFKTQIFTLTGVPPERQKILIKGGLLKDETDLDKLGIKEGQIFMVMGTAGDLPKAPEKPILFVEDMTDTQLAEAGNITGVDEGGNLTASMRDLFKQLGKTTEGSQPLVFLQSRLTPLI